MTVQKLDHFPLVDLIPVLEQDDWEWTLHDTLTAYYGVQGFGELRLVVDRSGRVQLRRITLDGTPEAKVVRESGRAYALHTETMRFTTVSTTLDSPADFETALAEMMALVMNPPEKDDAMGG